MTDPRARETQPSERLPSARASGGRKPYRTPELTCYGDVSQVIRGNNSNMAGDAGGGATKMCWIAEALYGVDAPRTRLVRAWLTARYECGSPWALVAVPLYRRFGRAIARGVDSNRMVRRACGALFDAAVRRAHRDYAPEAASSSRTSISPTA